MDPYNISQLFIENLKLIADAIIYRRAFIYRLKHVQLKVMIGMKMYTRIGNKKAN